MKKVVRIFEEEKEQVRLEAKAEFIENTVQVFQLFLQGKNIEQIARELKLSNTVVKEIVMKIKQQQQH